MGDITPRSHIRQPISLFCGEPKFSASDEITNISFGKRHNFFCPTWNSVTTIQKTFVKILSSSYKVWKIVNLLIRIPDPLQMSTREILLPTIHKADIPGRRLGDSYSELTGTCWKVSAAIMMLEWVHLSDSWPMAFWCTAAIKIISNWAGVKARPSS